MDCRPIANDLSVMILNVSFYFIDSNYCKSNSSELLIINIVLHNTKALTANIIGRILQGRGAKYYIGNVTSVVFFDDIWPSGMHVT